MKKFTVLIPLILSLFFINPAYAGDLCRVLKTGQTTSYATGDDGDLELGIAKDYTVLDAGQYSGTTNIVINGKTHALSNNCVQDNRTGLMWARYVSMADIGPAADGQLFWEQWTLGPKTDISFTAGTKIINSVAGDFSTSALCVGRKVAITGAGEAGNNQTVTVTAITANNMTVSEAIVDEAAGASVSLATVDDLIWDALDQANANSLGGYTDWRIPNYFELPSIINLGNYNPAIDTTVFPSTPATYHWTSSTNPCDTACAFLVHFYYGVIGSNVKQEFKYHIRFVRGDSSSYGIKLYITSSSGTYNDLTIDANDDEYGIVCIGDSNTFTDCDVEGGSNLVDGDTNSFTRCVFD